MHINPVVYHNQKLEFFEHADEAKLLDEVMHHPTWTETDLERLEDNMDGMSFKEPNKVFSWLHKIWHRFQMNVVHGKYEKNFNKAIKLLDEHHENIEREVDLDIEAKKTHKTHMATLKGEIAEATVTRETRQQQVANAKRQKANLEQAIPKMVDTKTLVVNYLGLKDNVKLAEENWQTAKEKYHECVGKMDDAKERLDGIMQKLSEIRGDMSSRIASETPGTKTKKAKKTLEKEHEAVQQERVALHKESDALETKEKEAFAEAEATKAEFATAREAVKNNDYVDEESLLSGNLASALQQFDQQIRAADEQIKQLDIFLTKAEMQPSERREAEVKEAQERYQAERGTTEQGGQT